MQRIGNVWDFVKTYWVFNCLHMCICLREIERVKRGESERENIFLVTFFKLCIHLHLQITVTLW